MCSAGWCVCADALGWAVVQSRCRVSCFRLPSTINLPPHPFDTGPIISSPYPEPRIHVRLPPICSWPVSTPS